MAAVRSTHQITTLPLLPGYRDGLSLSLIRENGKWVLEGSFLVSDFGVQAASMSDTLEPLAACLWEMLFGGVLVEALNDGSLAPEDFRHIRCPTSKDDVMAASDGHEVGGLLAGFWLFTQAYQRARDWGLPDGTALTSRPVPRLISMDCLPPRFGRADVWDAMQASLPLQDMFFSYKRTVLWGLWEKCAEVAGTIDPVEIAKSMGVSVWANDPTFLARLSDDVAGGEMLRRMKAIGFSRDNGSATTTTTATDVSDRGAGVAAWMLSHQLWLEGFTGEKRESEDNKFEEDALELGQGTLADQALLMFGAQPEGAMRSRLAAGAVLSTLWHHDIAFFWKTRNSIPWLLERRFGEVVNQMNQDGMDFNTIRQRIETILRVDSLNLEPSMIETLWDGLAEARCSTQALSWLCK